MASLACLGCEGNFPPSDNESELVITPGLVSAQVSDPVEDLSLTVRLGAFARGDTTVRLSCTFDDTIVSVPAPNGLVPAAGDFRIEGRSFRFSYRQAYESDASHILSGVICLRQASFTMVCDASTERATFRGDSVEVRCLGPGADAGVDGGPPLPGCAPEDATLEALSSDFFGIPNLLCSRLDTDTHRDCTQHSSATVGCQPGRGDHTELRAVASTTVRFFSEAQLSPLRAVVCAEGPGRVAACPPAPSPDLTMGDYVVAVAELEAPLPTALGTPCEYAFVFDADGSPANDWVAAPAYPNDFFQGTDTWLVARHTPGTGWALAASRVSGGAATPIATGARIVVEGDVVMAVIPVGLGGAGAAGIGPGDAMRFTAFCHTGDFGLSGGDWAGDLEPPVASGLTSCCATTCGDGRREAGEACDDGNTTAGDGCSADCASDETCGNGVVDAVTGEACDDGNTASGDGCSASCRTEVSACGDGALGPGESCDDGNTSDGDGCSARCAYEVPPAGSPRELTGSIAATDPTFTRTLPSCSGLATGSFYYDVFALENTSVAERVVTIDARWSIDGFLALYAWPFDPSAPATRCLTANDDFGGSGASRLADVVIAPGERVALVATTYAASTAAGGYTITLTTAASCGNGLLTGSEQCDDGGLVIGDGCDASCLFEPNRFCRGEPSTCVAVACGNGATEVGEGCDDANTTAGDGCSTRCASEIATSGGSIVLSGSLDAADPTYVRPYAAAGGCTPRPLPASVHPYDVFVVENGTGAAASLTVTAAWSGDGFLVVHRWPFNDAVPALHCLAGNDDFGGLGASRVASVPIAAGERLAIVATANVSVPIGAYTLTVQTD